MLILYDLLYDDIQSFQNLITETINLKDQLTFLMGVHSNIFFFSKFHIFIKFCQNFIFFKFQQNFKFWKKKFGQGGREMLLKLLGEIRHFNSKDNHLFPQFSNRIKLVAPHAMEKATYDFILRNRNKLVFLDNFIDVE